MKILFIMRFPLLEDYHLKTKFNGQMLAFANMGYEVDYLAYDNKFVYLINYNTGKKERVGKTHFRFLRAYRSTFGFVDLYSSLNKVAGMRKYDYAYFRNKAIAPNAINAFRRLKMNGCKLFVEIPSYGSNEKVLSKKRTVASKILHYLGKKLPPLVDLYLLIGLDGGGEYLGRPALNIKNGISVEQVPCKKNTESTCVHILALATMRIWHAFDRLIEGLSQYSGEFEFVIDMVGKDADGSLNDWVELAHKRGIGDKVIVHGPLFGDALDEMFDKCEIAVATLGFHRSGLSCGSTLKIREYTARGIPFIYGYRDESLTGEEFFALRVPANDEPIDMNVVDQWLCSIRKTSEITLKMREYASVNMSWEAEYKRVIELIAP